MKLETTNGVASFEPHSPCPTDSLVECYQDKKVAGDFARFLHPAASKVHRNRVLQDTLEHVYHFKRTINKKNKFGKVNQLGVEQI